MKIRCLLKLCVWSALSVLTPGVLANASALDASVRGLEGGQALLSIETHRSAIVERLVADYAAVLAQRGVDADSLRRALTALRADQLLAASLVNSLDEVLQVVHEPDVASDTSNQRYVALTPTASLALIPEAQAYLVRDGDTLNVVQPSALQLTGTNRVVGYFTAAPGVTTVIQKVPILKDGSGSGSSSWIGYTAGGNVASGTGSAVAAGTSNVASGQNAFIGAGTFNAATAQGAFVGGGTSNVAAGTSSLVLGGFDNQARVIDALVVAGAGNRATGARSVVVGGGYNLASGQWSFVGGGGRQTANSGGAGTYFEDNVAAGDWSTVGGGKGNRAGDASSSSGTAYSTVGGGYRNTASGNYATVAGGVFNIASNYGATVAGGYGNTASSDYATVAGGISNTASGAQSMVVGGDFNLASGNYALVGGHIAKAREDGMFVWADSSPFSYDPTTFRAAGQSANTFNVRATGIGGVYFTTGIDATTGAPTWGCYAQNGSGWTCTSDRKAKRNLIPLNGQAVLAKVVALPLYQWQPKEGPHADLKHIGPMAQDFFAAFGLGDSDTSIGMQDEEGVALSAIQGLRRLVKVNDAATQRRLRQKDAKLAAQARRIAKLEHQAINTQRLAARVALLELKQDEMGALNAALPGSLRDGAQVTEAGREANRH